jgi:hypothetical protein
MHTPYVIRGNGPPDGTAPSGFIATERSGFYASLGSVSKFSVLRGLVPPFLVSFCVVRAAGISHLHRPHCLMPIASSSGQCHSDIH